MRFSVISVIASASLAGGCASIVSGTSQDISVEARQRNTLVTGVDCELVNSKGSFYVLAPGIAKVNRAGDSLTITCSKKGMASGTATLSPSTKSTTFGNLVLGGAIGGAIDRESGAAFEYPEAVSVYMGANVAVSGKAEAGIPEPALSANAPATKPVPQPLVSAMPVTTAAGPAAPPAAVSINDLRYLLPPR